MGGEDGEEGDEQGRRIGETGREAWLIWLHMAVFEDTTFYVKRGRKVQKAGFGRVLALTWLGGRGRRCCKGWS